MGNDLDGIYRDRDPGWYADPDYREVFRYYDGYEWTDQVRPPPSPDPPPEPSVAAQAGKVLGWSLVTVAVGIVLLIVGGLVALFMYGGDDDVDPEPRNPLAADVAKANELAEVLAAIGQPGGWQISVVRPPTHGAGQATDFRPINTASRHFELSSPQSTHVADLVEFADGLVAAGWTEIHIQCSTSGPERGNVHIRSTNVVAGDTLVLDIYLGESFADGRTGSLSLATPLVGASPAFPQPVSEPECLR